MNNHRGVRAILALAISGCVGYAVLAWLGDLRQATWAYLALHGALAVVMCGGWWVARAAGPQVLRAALIAALLFRVIASLGPPALSDDVYRYVWDGRVQIHGVHPYRFAPLDPELESLRDERVWPKINHPELRTIYPPLSQAVFVVLAGLRAGVTGFKLALGLIDFAVVLALYALARALSLPRERVLLYAWNPLAVIESAGSGHHEPIGVVLLVLAVCWLVRERAGRSALGLAGAIQAKLLPLILVPGFLRRWKGRDVLVFGGALLVLMLPYALTGPAVGPGLFDYVERWERNSVAYVVVERGIEALEPTPWLKNRIANLEHRWGPEAADWDWWYRHVWPRDLARVGVALLAIGWAVGLSFRPGLSLPRETFLALAGLLLLSPTLHPWYVIWVLPFAALLLSRGWLLFAALVPLSYLGGQEVAWTIRAVEYGPPLLVLAWDARRHRARGR